MKKRKRLFWQLYPLLLLISVVTLVGLLLITRYTFQDFFYGQVKHSLEEKAYIIQEEYKRQILNPSQKNIQAYTLETGKKLRNRVTLILPNGKVIADSKKSPELLDNHRTRPEIQLALAGEVGTSIRFSDTLKEDYFFLAIPIKNDSKVIGVLRNSVPVSNLKELLSGIYRQIVMVGALFIILLAAVNWWLTQKISSPLEVLKNYATNFKENDFEEIPLHKGDNSLEIESLNIAFNRMGRRIHKQFKKISNQKEEREAVFNSMVEGVLSINLEGELFHWNKAACDLFDVNREELQKGLPLKDTFKNQKLSELFNQSLEEQKVIEEEMELDNNRVLQVHVTPLYTSSGSKMGVLFVFNEITKLRELENHRKQFVANVSHELRTPLTAIQGFVETLMDDDIDRETRSKFLMIIKRHTIRLGNIIEDLLALSNIERDTNNAGITFEPSDISHVIAQSIENCERKAKAKNIKIISHSSRKNYTYPLNSHLMEQAISNLIENAVKYSPAQTEIDVDLNQTDKGFEIKVKDEGPGIPLEHHERLFERFYSVDKARSREMGGSGLGLSIVKHIVKAHGGDVTIKSELNKGSTFTISLPS